MNNFFDGTVALIIVSSVFTLISLIVSYQMNIDRYTETEYWWKEKGSAAVASSFGALCALSFSWTIGLYHPQIPMISSMILFLCALIFVIIILMIFISIINRNSPLTRSTKSSVLKFVSMMFALIIVRISSHIL